jgi:hypothetical protein
MNYLVLYREDTRMVAAIPPPALFEAIDATTGWLKELKGSGRAVECGYFAGPHGGFAVFKANSAAELTELVESCPARPFCEVEVIPVASADELAPVIAKSKAKALEVFAKIAQMMAPKH